MKILVIYRYWRGSNLKGRPEWFSKELSLRSFVESIEGSRHQHQVLFVVDGTIDKGIEQLMAAIGQVEIRSFGSNEGSWRYCLAKARCLGGDFDVVYFVEDDYLHIESPDLMYEAIAAGVDYATPYNHPDYETLRFHRGVEPRKLIPPAGWRYVRSTCLTFAAAPSAFVADDQLFCVLSLGDSSLWAILTSVNKRDRLRALTTAPERGLTVRHAVREDLIGRVLRCWGRSRGLIAPTSSLAVHAQEAMVHEDDRVRVEEVVRRLASGAGSEWPDA